MKKRIAAPIFAVIVAVGGWLYGNYGSESDTTALQVVEEVPEQLQKVQKEGLAPGKYVDAYVVKVMDGDTFEVTYKGDSYKVRMLCMDTPESVKQGVEVQPYSKEAAELTGKFILNKSVRLVFDRDIFDRYGRLLAFVIVKQGTQEAKDLFLNAYLVRNGFARVEIVSPNSTYSSYFKGLLQKAVEDKAGMWGMPEGKQPFVKDVKGQYVPRYKVKDAA